MILAGPQRLADHISEPLTLGAISASPGTVRVAAHSLLIEWGLTELADSVELIASELVTNAVQVSAEYTVPPPVEFRMSATGKTVLIEVWDHDPRQPVIRRPARLDEGGRGLVLVATVSARWGWTTFQEGKIVWAEVR
jgi:anti-sigma regulatory factor (Ser/Thr protein kinase)